MAESSSGGSPPPIPKWQCIHCPVQVLGVRPGFFDICPACGKKQIQELEEDTSSTSNINPEHKPDESPEEAQERNKPQEQRELAITPPDPSKSVEKHKMRIAEAVECEKQKIGSTEQALTPDDGSQSAQPRPETAQVSPGKQSTSKAAEGTQVSPKNGENITPNSSNSEASLADSSDQTEASTSTLAQDQKPPKEQDPNVDPKSSTSSPDASGLESEVKLKDPNQQSTDIGKDVGSQGKMIIMASRGFH